SRPRKRPVTKKASNEKAGGISTGLSSFPLLLSRLASERTARSTGRSGLIAPARFGLFFRQRTFARFLRTLQRFRLDGLQHVIDHFLKVLGQVRLGGDMFNAFEHLL